MACWFQSSAHPSADARSISLTRLLGDDYRLDLIARNADPIRGVLDIGANVGWFSLAARDHFPEAKIHAYEPNPAVAAVLRRNIAGLQISLYGEAVGAIAGKVAMALSVNGESNQGRVTDGGSILRISLAEAIRRLGCVDLIKLDCEGAEWPMLNDPALWPAVRYLTMEYHLFARPGATHNDAIQAVERLGSTVSEHRPRSTYGLLLGQPRPLTEVRSVREHASPA
jgi:FkbM family methyltransferase